MYKCPYCNTPYDEPRTIRDDANGGGTYSVSVSEYCPICGQPADSFYDRADQCQCGNYKNVRDALCHDCHAKLLKRFCAFADGLTEPEENDLDAMLDGNSITDRNKWR